MRPKNFKTLQFKYSQKKNSSLIIPFNKPYFQANGLNLLANKLLPSNISGNGVFTEKCHEFFKEKYGFNRCLLTNSCTSALEVTAAVMDLNPDDEIIIPAYTFPSSVNPFLQKGCKIKFADSESLNPNISLQSIRDLITNKTKAIVVVHYAGIACNIESISALCKNHNLFLIEDCAHALDADNNETPLGSYGDFAAFSFHQTKNITCGEGGLLVINNDSYFNKAEIVWEKGTNKSSFLRKEVDQYEWKSIGTSALPSEITAGVLYNQLQHLKLVQEKRLKLWNRYNTSFLKKNNNSHFRLPDTTAITKHNAHSYYLICNSKSDRDNLIQHLLKHRISATAHYQNLANSNFAKELKINRVCINAQKFEEQLIRLPIYPDLKTKEVDYIISTIINYFETS